MERHASTRRGDRVPRRRGEVRVAPMHICLVYDCLFPWTYGGAERWYRNLAERLPPRGARGDLSHAPAGDQRAAPATAARTAKRIATGRVDLLPNSVRRERVPAQSP